MKLLLALAATSLAAFLVTPVATAALPWDCAPGPMSGVKCRVVHVQIESLDTECEGSYGYYQVDGYYKGPLPYGEAECRASPW